MLSGVKSESSLPPFSCVNNYNLFNGSNFGQDLPSQKNFLDWHQIYFRPLILPQLSPLHYRSCFAWSPLAPAASAEGEGSPDPSAFPVFEALGSLSGMSQA